MRKLLIITAHPDDETLCAGGTLALLAARGVQVTIACSTRGEGGKAGDPPLCRQEDLGVVRERELRAAAAVLGVKRTLFLGYVDPPIGPDRTLYAATDDIPEFADRIGRVLHRLRPQVVLTHGSDGEYGHPQHVATHRAALMAWEWYARKDAALYTFGAAIPQEARFGTCYNRSDPATLVVDISSVLSRKQQALACHATQVTTIMLAEGAGSLETLFPPWEGFRLWAGPDLLRHWLPPECLCAFA